MIAGRTFTKEASTQGGMLDAIDFVVEHGTGTWFADCGHAQRLEACDTISFADIILQECERRGLDMTEVQAVGSLRPMTGGGERVEYLACDAAICIEDFPRRFVAGRVVRCINSVEDLERYRDELWDAESRNAFNKYYVQPALLAESFKDEKTRTAAIHWCRQHKAMLFDRAGDNIAGVPLWFMRRSSTVALRPRPRKAAAAVSQRSQLTRVPR